ncbi:MAG: 30S ribosomal protein S4 [Erysipelotrichia bacterium]|jgi:small subunit ribosomal protein S4|nr:30S ribosomal protein S4 [Erysipelotrichia bacterium]
MARIIGKLTKKSRRYEFMLTERPTDLRRSNAPGAAKDARRAKLSNYALQLREKQRIRFTYGVTERQFYNTYLKSAKIKGVHGHNFLGVLESRLDNLVYRAGFANTRAGARQLVNHGHVLVDGVKVDIPSFIVSKGQVISFKETSTKLDVITEALAGGRAVPTFLDVNKDNRTAKLLHFPERTEIANDFNESLVVEFYNR